MAQVDGWEVQLIGTGTSGVRLVTSLVVNNQSQFKTIPLYLSKDKSSSTRFAIKDIPIVFVDDDVVTGKTVQYVAHRIREYERINMKTGLLDRVEGVIVKCVERTMKEADQERLLKEVFPKLKWWIL